MMRSDQRRGYAWGVLFLGLAAAWGPGCKKEQPVASAPVDAGVAVVDAGAPDAGVAQAADVVKPLRFSDVTLKRQDNRLAVTYTLTNPGTAQGRGEACLSLHDDQGMVIEAERMGGITVKGGTTDTFRDSVGVGEASWKQARTLMLYTTAEFGCSYGASVATSELLRLLPTGQPAPAGTPPPQKPQVSKATDFEVSNVEVRQGPSDYFLTYTVKNVSDHRASGSGCLRAYMALERAPALEESPEGDFSLAPGASQTFTESIVFDNEKNWDEVMILRLFTSPHGCADDADAENAGFKFMKPAYIHAPVEEVEVESGADAEDPTGMDSSDAYDPEEEFPQPPPDSDDASEGTAD
ncbi:hypothetical protein [Corallococcus aberystwythensis]|uniref:Uncharacterized protein n=1 Tax=Corallococcus aberystwythensis TaxID=2316722 RepID=A0A3A8QR15_9BACT|nr:hypothetical protein [Corallococcus aberystwythensis]RKH70977.1 hypothetical protein D7W81_08505 [Corallococcus aberystwythensis]